MEQISDIVARGCVQCITTYLTGIQCQRLLRQNTLVIPLHQGGMVQQLYISSVIIMDDFNGCYITKSNN